MQPLIELGDSARGHHQKNVIKSVHEILKAYIQLLRSVLGLFLSLSIGYSAIEQRRSL